MPKVLLDHERKKDYAKWIGSIYDRLQMEDEEFVQYVVHFVKKSQSKTVEDYRCFTEGSVKNWIQDNYPPVDVCSFLCFATLEYDSFVKENPKVPAKPLDQANTGNAVAYLDLTLNERNCRYDYVKECMWKYLQMRLYCRNLQDALMIQVVRGIFSFHELKSVKDACEQIIKGISISKAEKEQKNNTV